MSSQVRTRFGQLVIGPPGSGKTTYVAAMAEMLRSLGRKVAIVNLDPANENMTYQPDVDVADLGKPSFKKNRNFMKNFHKMVTPPPRIVFVKSLFRF